MMISTIKKRRSSDDVIDTGKRFKTNVKLEGSTPSTRPKPSKPLLEKFREACGNFTYKEGVIAGPCIVCNKEQSLSWYDWKQHLLKHTGEKRFYCFECNVQLSNKSEHTDCPPETIIDVFGDQNVGYSLDGFICQLCDHFLINDYKLMDHLDKDHDELGALFEIHAARVTLVPDVQPEEHIIQTDYAYVPQKERYRCGIGLCTLHLKTFTEYSEHYRKAHSIIKTYFCPHCNLLMNRLNTQTVEHQRILQHIECHGRILHQCVSCEFVTTSEDEIRAHIVDQHSEPRILFWRNRRKDDGATDSELIEIVLDCGLCGERVLNIPAALDHFKEAHQGFAIDFKAVKHIKTTTKQLEVTCSTDDSILRYTEVLLCGLCDGYFTDKHDWFKHFSEMHASDDLAVRRGFRWTETILPTNNIKFDRHMLYFCKFCSNDGKFEGSSRVEDIYDHWKQQHMNDDGLPFQYYMADIVACNYCDVMSTFQGLKEHVAIEHPDDPFIPIKAFVSGKHCALCDHGQDDNEDLEEHVKSKHALAFEADVFNPIPVHQHDLMKLVQVKTHQKLKCGYCNEIFNTRDMYRAHHSTEHPKLERMSREFFDKDSILLIGDCCHQPIEPNLFLDHLEYHKYSLKCEKCTFRATDPFNFMRHKVDAHEATQSVSDLYRNFLQLRYWRSEMIFGNGLVLNKFNTQGSEYDYTTQFENFANRLMAEKVEEFEGKQNIL